MKNGSINADLFSIDPMVSGYWWIEVVVYCSSTTQEYASYIHGHNKTLKPKEIERYEEDCATKIYIMYDVHFKANSKYTVYFESKDHESDIVIKDPKDVFFKKQGLMTLITKHA